MRRISVILGAMMLAQPALAAENKTIDALEMSTRCRVLAETFVVRGSVIAYAPNQDSAFCLGFFSAALQAYAPTCTTATNLQYMLIFRKYVAANPLVSHMWAMRVMAMAQLEAFPCNDPIDVEHPMDDDPGPQRRPLPVARGK